MQHSQNLTTKIWNWKTQICIQVFFHQCRVETGAFLLKFTQDIYISETLMSQGNRKHRQFHLMSKIKVDWLRRDVPARSVSLFQPARKVYREKVRRGHDGVENDLTMGALDAQHIQFTFSFSVHRVFFFQ